MDNPLIGTPTQARGASQRLDERAVDQHVHFCQQVCDSIIWWMLHEMLVSIAGKANQIEIFLFPGYAGQHGQTPSLIKWFSTGERKPTDLVEIQLRQDLLWRQLQGSPEGNPIWREAARTMEWATLDPDRPPRTGPERLCAARDRGNAQNSPG